MSGSPAVESHRATLASAAHILITGASGGLGAALARAYAAPGVHLLLWGRDERRLHAAALACRERGARVETTVIDLCRVDAMLAALERALAQAPIRLAFLNAGIGGVIAKGRVLDAPERTYEMAMVNFTAAVVAATAIGDAMARKGGGHIVLIGSVADFLPLPMSPTYAGTKAGLAMFAEALGLRLKPHGVAVTVVAPGFIDTPMSRALEAPRPFLVSAEAAAALIKRRIARQPKRLVFPWPFAMLRSVIPLVPRPLLRAVLRRL